jgi:putative membrane protein
MSKFVPLVATCFALSTVSAFAQKAPATNTFVAEVAAGSTAEVEAGRLAETKANNKSVKDFGATMVKDHTKAGEDLTAALKKDNKPAPAKALSKDGRELVDKLTKASTAQFDRMYVDAMVEDHKKDVAAFEAYAKSGDDPQIKAFAEQTLPVLKHHYQMIQSIQANNMKSTSR